MSTRTLPLRGAANPSSFRDGTNPGSFANAPNLGGALSFSSPDTPGMPQPSDKTAWNFLPEGWRVKQVAGDTPEDTFNPAACVGGDHPSVTFRTGSWSANDGFSVDPASQTAVPPRIEPDDRGAPYGGPTRLLCSGSRELP